MIKSKRILATWLTLCLMLALFPSLPARAADFSGEGTAANPYRISNAADLSLLATNLNADTYFELTSDITLAGSAFTTPIGDSSYPFQGSFEGTATPSRGLRSPAGVILASLAVLAPTVR